MTRSSGRPFGDEQVCFSVSGAKKDDFDALTLYQHPDKYTVGKVKASDKPVEFVGMIVKADDSKYSGYRLTPTAQQQKKSDLEFNTTYYIQVYNVGAFELIQKIGIIVFIAAALLWTGVIVMGNLESRKYGG